MARPASVFAKIKSEKQREELTTLWKQHANHYTSIRGHAILLSDDNYNIQQIVDVLGVDRDTVRSWNTRFDDVGVEGLLEEDKPGCQSALEKGPPIGASKGPANTCISDVMT